MCVAVWKLEAFKSLYISTDYIIDNEETILNSSSDCAGHHGHLGIQIVTKMKCFVEVIFVDELV